MRTHIKTLMRQLAKRACLFAGNKIFPAFLLTSSIAASVAQAAPQNGVIVGGQGNISSSGTVTNINQNTGSMVVDWSSFNVNSNETVNFNQPSTNAAALNRIYDQNPSQIFGAINANGRVFLSNPNGMVFGQTATVNVGALMATGLSISKDDFMSGKYHFNSDGYTPGAIINRGILTAASGGSISLVGGRVANEGYIVADYGQINLATGKQAIVNFDGDGLISFQVSEDILTNLDNAESSIANSGALQANGGQILLDAHVAKDVFTHAVNNSGMIKAHRINNSGGEIYLSSNDSTVHSGEIDAYGENGAGGSVFILGDNVALTGNATVNASGEKNGGTILIGGDYQGSGVIKTAQFTTVAEGVVIEADAEQQGDGGKVIVWSDDTTVFHGKINARARGVDGDGGFAEISGKQHLLVSGHADLRAVNGNAGTLYLDPGSVSVVAGANTAPPGAMDTFNDGWINDQLTMTSVIIDTFDSTNAGTEDITIDAAAAITWANSNSLTLRAGNDINVNGSITATGTGVNAGTINLLADTDGLGDGTITLAATGSLTSNGGDINLNADDVTIDVASSISAAAGNVTINSSIASQEIRVSTNNNIARLDLSEAELLRITANKLILGGTTHTGLINVNQLTTLANITTIALTNDGDISINDNLTNSAASGVIELNADAAGDGGVGSITAASGKLLSANTVNLTAASGIGTAANNVLTSAAAVNFNNTASSDIYINNTGDVLVSGSNTGRNVTLTSSLTLGQSGVIDAATLTTTSTGNTDLTTAANTIDAYNGTTITSGNISILDSVGGLDITGISTASGNTTVTTTGALTQSGVINTTLLTTTSNTGSTDLTTAANTIDAYNGTTTTAGSISILDTAGGLDITGINSVGDATVTTTGALTQSGVINATLLTTASVLGSTDLTANNTVSTFNGSTSGANQALSFTNTSGELNISGITASGDVTLTSDRLAINAPINAGNRVTLKTVTANRLIDLGSAGSDPTKLELSNAEINRIFATNLSLGDTAAGAIDISSALSLTNISNLHLISSGTVSDSGTGALSGNKNLAISTTGGAVTLDNANHDINTIAIDAGTNNVVFVDAGVLSPLTVGVVDGVTGIISNDLNLVATSNNVIVTSNITAGGTIEVTTLTPDRLFELTAGNTITGNAGSHIYTADRMKIAGNIVASGQKVSLQSATSMLDIDLGSFTDIAVNRLELSSTELSNVTADTLVVGRSNVGDIFVTGYVTPSNVNNLHLISGNQILANSGFAILGNKNLAITAGGEVRIDNATTDVNTLAIDAAGSNVYFSDANGVTVGDVDGITGITANNLVLTSLGPVVISDGLATNDINVADTVILNATGSSITGGGSIVAQKLGLDAGAGNNITLTSTTSDVDIIATSSTAKGTITFTDVDDLTIGAVTIPGSATVYDGITASGLDLTSGGLLTVDAASSISSGAGVGNFTLRADKMAIDGTIDAGTVTTGTVRLVTATTSLAIDLGSSSNMGAALELSNAEIQKITAGAVIVGDATAGNIILTDIISPGSTTNALHLISGGNIESTGNTGIVTNRGIALEAGGAITFSDANTNVLNLAANAVQDLTFTNAGQLVILDVDGVSDLTGDNIRLTINSNIVSGLDQNSNITANGNIIIELLQTGSVFATSSANVNQITSASGDITIIADTLQLDANDLISGSATGNLILQPFTTASTMGIGNTSFGSFNLNLTELATIQDGFASINIGSSTVGSVLIADAAFNDNLNISGGNITVINLNAFTNDVVLNASGFIRGGPLSIADITADEITLIAANGGIGENANRLNVTAVTAVNADTTADSGTIHIETASNLPLGLINAGGGTVNLISDMMITDANGVDNNVVANDLYINADDGIGAIDQIEIDVNILTAVNDVAGDINILEANNVTLFDMYNENGDASLVVSNDLTIQAGSVIQTVMGGSVSLIAGNAINSNGAFTVMSAGGFSFNKAINAAGAVAIKTVDPLDITENITTMAGDITLDSTAISFSPGVVLSAVGALNILNAASTASGDLTFIANGIDLSTALTVNNGNLTLNAGIDDLSISSAVTVNKGNLQITAADLEITATGSIAGSDTVTISDSGNGMELGGTADAAKLNISLNEYELITAGNLVLSTQNTLTLKDTFQTTASLSPLSINANQFNVTQAGAVLGLLGNLDLLDTPVNAPADFTVNVAGAFNMNNTITTNGVFSLTAGLGVTMGEPSSIVSNNHTINITANGGDILLGLANAGTADVNLTASAGSVLNNNGVFTDVTRSKTNIIGTNTTITANQRIGASSTDAITIDTSPSGLITLDFNAEKAFINNLQNTRIQNNGSGDVAVGLIFSGQIIGVGHNVGLRSQNTEETPVENDSSYSLISVLGSDYKLSSVDEEEEDSSTLNNVVPVMIRTKDGWEFKAPLNTPVDMHGPERKVNWL